MEDLRRQWLAAFSSIGTPAIGKDTAARILAVIYVHGNNEAFVYNHRLIDEIHHIQEIYKISGGETPDDEMRELIKKYVKELEDYEEMHINDKYEAVFVNKAPAWAHTLFKERYDIKLIN